MYSIKTRGVAKGPNSRLPSEILAADNPRFFWLKRRRIWIGMHCLESISIGLRKNSRSEIDVVPLNRRGIKKSPGVGANSCHYVFLGSINGFDVIGLIGKWPGWDGKRKGAVGKLLGFCGMLRGCLNPNSDWKIVAFRRLVFDPLKVDWFHSRCFPCAGIAWNKHVSGITQDKHGLKGTGEEAVALIGKRSWNNPKWFHITLVALGGESGPWNMEMENLSFMSSAHPRIVPQGPGGIALSGPHLRYPGDRDLPASLGGLFHILIVRKLFIKLRSLEVNEGSRAEALHRKSCGHMEWVRLWRQRGAQMSSRDIPIYFWRRERDWEHGEKWELAFTGI